MNEISKEIYVTQKRLEVYIDVTCGTDLVPITLNVIDYEIPAETTATVYSIGKENKLKKQICTISENAISFTPQKGFFEVGSNLLQVRMTYQNKDLISFEIMVIGHESIVSDDAEEVNNNHGLMQQLLSEIGVLSARLNEALKIPEGGTTADAALNDIKVGYNGTVYDSPGDAVRGQVGELKSDLVNQENALNSETKRAIKRENEIEELFTMPTQEAVNKWLDEHPESTTTVQDGSITEEKIYKSFL